MPICDVISCSNRSGESQRWTMGGRAWMRGVGLSAIMIVQAAGANVIGVDLDLAKLALAKELGAIAAIDGKTDVFEAIKEITKGGAHVSLDALGHPITMTNSILCLRPRGKHIQVGLMLGDHAAPSVPMPKIVGQEIELLGLHGMQAHRYGAMLDMVESGKLNSARLVGDKYRWNRHPML
jgi:D-arabinose 1-dehydrogenase-like Zn-dependent alcohol dehydrogenase